MPGPDLVVPGFDIPNVPFPNVAFGAAYGQVFVNNAPQRLINGLTISQFVTVYALASNTKAVYIGDKNVSPSTGFPIEGGKNSIVLDTRLSPNTWWAISADGSSQMVAFITNVSDVGTY